MLGNRIASTLLHAGNPYAIPYSELVAATDIKHYTIDCFKDFSVMDLDDLQKHRYDSFSIQNQSISLNFDKMEFNNPVKVISANLTAGTQFTHPESFASGNELMDTVLEDSVSSFDSYALPKVTALKSEYEKLIDQILDNVFSDFDNFLPSKK